MGGDGSRHGSPGAVTTTGLSVARSRKSEIVDGFSVYKAAQRAQGGKQPPEAAESPPVKGEGEETGSGRKIGSHIGRTVLPSKHEVTCYECGYEFQLAGAIKSTYCSKCRAKLTVENVTIDRAWSADVKTAGVLRIAADGVVEGGVLMANHVILEGRVTGGHVRAFRWLELRTAAGYAPEWLEATRLRIGADAHLILPEVRFDQVEILGTLKARIHAGEWVHVKDGGRVEGEVHTPQVDVELGGVLKAMLEIRPSGLAGARPDSADGVALGRTA
jgi:cytoskeletal protein CcmA (bactofilin family)